MKTTPKKYTVTRRFAAWVSTEVTANSFDEAVEKGKKLNWISHFVEVPRSTELIDSESLPGFGVQETF